MNEPRAEDQKFFLYITVLFIIVLPTLWTIWPISDGVSFLAFDAKLIVIIPLAYWMLSLLRNDDTRRNTLLLTLAICGMAIALYMLKNGNLYMNSKFEPVTVWERFEVYACYFSFAYACFFTLLCLSRLLGPLVSAWRR